MILIVIVTYNGQEYIKKCLEDIFNLPYSELILIDNGSTDKTIDIIEKNYPSVNLIKNSKNIGFGQANNIGLSYAIKKKFNFVLLLNQDTYITQSTIKELVEIMKNNHNYGILSPLHFLSENHLQRSFSNHIASNKNLTSDLEKNVFSKEIYDVPFVNAAIWLLSQKCIQKVGGFNPSFFHYGEDDNYCHRVIYHNLKIGIVPLSKAYHFNYENQNKYYSKNNVLKFINIFKGIYSNPNNKWIINRDIIIYMFQLTYNLFRLKISVLNIFLLVKNILFLDFKKMNTYKAKSMYDNTPFIS